MSDVLTMALSEPQPQALSFDALYRESASDVFAYAMSLLRDRAAAEDATALAFEKAYRKRSTYKAEKGSPRGWLFGIARNVVLDELRRRKRTAALVTDVEDAATAPGAGDDDEEAAARRATVRAALATLDARDRELVALKFHAGLSNAEIGRVAGLSESNAGTKLHRAMTRLREACHAHA